VDGINNHLGFGEWAAAWSVMEVLVPAVAATVGAGWRILAGQKSASLITLTWW
jgi:hypothetical protein